MAVHKSASLTNQKTLAHLRALRMSLDQARSALMHYKDDRVDRDKLEPAARRIDDLMNLFVTGAQDPVQTLAWMTEIRVGIDTVTNPKAAAPLQTAGVEIAALLALITPAAPATPPGALPA